MMRRIFLNILAMLPFCGFLKSKEEVPISEKMQDNSVWEADFATYRMMFFEDRFLWMKEKLYWDYSHKEFCANFPDFIPAKRFERLWRKISKSLSSSNDCGLYSSLNDSCVQVHIEHDNLHWYGLKGTHCIINQNPSIGFRIHHV
jgi:hypothetical protein